MAGLTAAALICFSCATTRALAACSAALSMLSGRPNTAGGSLSGKASISAKWSGRWAEVGGITARVPIKGCTRVPGPPTAAGLKNWCR